MGLQKTLSVDWLQGTFPHDRVDSLVDLLKVLLGEDGERMEHGQYRYNRSVSWVGCGVRVLFDNDDARARDIHGGRAAVVLPGGALGGLDAVALQSMLKTLVSDYWFKATRVDLAWDDYTRRITPSDVCVEADKGNYSRFRSHRHILERSRGGEVTGDTVYFGARGKNGGGRFLRCYDKGLESDGRINAIRWECEFSKEKAAQVVFALYQTESLEEFCAVIGAYVGGCVDFVERRTEGKLRGAERLEWWQGIVDSLGESRLRNERRVRSVEGTRKWVRAAVFPSLKVLREALGSVEWEEFLLDVKHVAIRGYQKAMVSDYRARRGVAEHVSL